MQEVRMVSGCMHSNRYVGKREVIQINIKQKRMRYVE